MNEIRYRVSIIREGLTEVDADEHSISLRWDEEADARHHAFLAGDLNPVPAKEALARLRSHFVEPT